MLPPHNTHINTHWITPAPSFCFYLLRSISLWYTPLFISPSCFCSGTHTHAVEGDGVLCYVKLRLCTAHPIFLIMKQKLVYVCVFVCVCGAVDQRAEYIFASSLRRGTLSTHQRHLLPGVCVCVVRTSADVRCVFESVTAHCLPTQLKIPSHGPLTKTAHLDREITAPEDVE